MNLPSVSSGTRSVSEPIAMNSCPVLMQAAWAFFTEFTRGETVRRLNWTRAWCDGFVTNNTNPVSFT